MIKEIGRREFIRHLSLENDLEHFIGKEVEWYANPTGSLIGTIAFGDRSRGWNYVIFKRNRAGRFHVSRVVCDFYDRAAARVDFMFAMIGGGFSSVLSAPGPVGN